MPDPATSVRFADAARRLAAECRMRGLVAPAFRSPPGLTGSDRTLRRRPDGGMVVAVRVRGRPMSTVVADLVEGVLAANRLDPGRAAVVRRQLLSALEVVLAARAA
ncbi:MAG: hypothetical protein ABR540_08835 [Acidimicrobiales bacterium]